MIPWCTAVSYSTILLNRHYSCCCFEHHCFLITSHHYCITLIFVFCVLLFLYNCILFNCILFYFYSILSLPVFILYSSCYNTRISPIRHGQKQVDVASSIKEGSKHWWCPVCYYHMYLCPRSRPGFEAQKMLPVSVRAPPAPPALQYILHTAPPAGWSAEGCLSE